MTNITWSPYQEAVFAAFASTGSYTIDAKAGSAKTTTGVEGLRRTSTPAVAFAFNKSIADEFNTRLTGTPHTAATMNSAGHRAWGKALGRRLSLDADKMYKLLRQIDPAQGFGDILALARAARTSGLIPNQFSQKGLVPDTPDTWDALGDYFDIEVNAYNIAQARQLMAEGIKAAYAGSIDFDDQIYMSALFSGVFTRSPLVVIDEAQDLSPLQHEMLRRIASDRIFIIGDPNQAIYGFRGASANSMAELGRAFSTETLPLSVSYRCPQSVVREAQHFVPAIEPWANAPEGIVDTWPEASVADIPSGAHVVCRYNGPLFKLAWRLIKSGRGCKILGAEIGQGLVKLIQKLAPADIPMRELLARLRSWAQAEIEAKPHKEAIIRDKELSIISIAEAVHTSQELCSLIDRMFSSPGTITLSSIHKAKGKEWDTVVFFLPQLCPSQYATSDWQLEQEANLQYVAVTRAKRHLIYLEQIR